MKDIQNVVKSLSLAIKDLVSGLVIFYSESCDIPEVARHDILPINQDKSARKELV